MLRGINPLLTADLLHALASMGHGDEVVIVDANFPAAAIAKKLIVLGGSKFEDAFKAILSVFPLDGSIENPVSVMDVPGNFLEPAIKASDISVLLKSIDGVSVNIGRLERHQFYARARDAFVVVQTAERRFYGNAILCKGVIGPDDRAI